MQDVVGVLPRAACNSLCKRALPAARAEALRFMADKKKTSKPSDNTSVSKDADDAVIDIDETETQVNEATTTRKKRKTIQGSLSSFIDNAMTTTQKNSADRKLLRFVIHANVAFRSVENPFLHDFLHDLRPTYNAPGRYAL
ncbi:hypothetical protein DFH09DRAFT_909694, partial [Mycena vulgaris]